MENLTLHAFLGDPQTIKIMTIASFVGQTVNLNIVKPIDLRSKKFKRNLTLNTIPALEIGENKFLGHTNSIIRYLARNKENGLGANNYEIAQLDQILDTILNNISPASTALLSSIRGIVKYSKKVVGMASNDVVTSLKSIEASYFKTSGFLIGDSLTIADLVLFTTLVPLFTGAISFKKLKAVKKIKALCETLAKDPIATKFTGKVGWMDATFGAPKDQ